MESDIRRFSSSDEMAVSVANLIREISRHTVAQKGRCMIALSGGNTPRKLFAVLSSPEYAEKIPWQNIRLYWVDERCVPDTSPDSNFGTAFELLVSKVPLPKENVRPVLAHLKPYNQTALEYETLVRRDFGTPGIPRFDLILLGMGSDGHTASLFPGSPALNEKQRLYVAVDAPEMEPRVERITRTLPLINASKNVAFMVAGNDKTVLLNKILDGSDESRKYPASLIRPDGNLLWFISGNG